YARALMERTASILDIDFWSEVTGAVSYELARLSRVLASWRNMIVLRGWLNGLLGALGLVAVFGAAFAMRTWFRRRYANGTDRNTRFGKAWTGLRVFFTITLLSPIVVLVVIQVLTLFGLWTSQLDDIAVGVVIGMAAMAFGRGAARGLLSPDRPARRLIPLTDAAAETIADHIVWSTRILAAVIILQVTHKAFVAPLALTIATNMLFAAAIAGMIVHLVLGLRRLEENAQADIATAALPWLRPLGWIVVGLLAGYSGLAAFVAFRAVVATALGCALYLWLVTIDALFSEALSAETPRGRRLAANLGIAPRSAGLIGTVLSAVIRTMLVLFVVAVILGPWEASTADLAASVPAVPLAFRIGEISISLRGLFSGLLALLVVLALTRVAQRWLQSRFLPQTSLEPSLQLSVATIFGYVGAIFAIALALGALGIDLQKIAFVAGALSVGIGFGLQSIVSNFVSGLILLAERPIRVGDSIVVKGEEGWVRRIRVRATEIETFERASVIIPNSELITGMVKNWTHANTLGRIILKVNVTYDADTERVREALEGVARAHALVVKAPPPRAYLLGFGDNALNFELRCVIANIDQGLAVRSDLHFAVLKAFRENGIRIPVPPLVAAPAPWVEPVAEADAGPETAVDVKSAATPSSS
ncbi:MAG: mechanosensitive ion channel family protein, partial [Rhizobiales bacterium]|nr:mechanosensitive ion channel family protein [Hyphomicrobiales bacterium]